VYRVTEEAVSDHDSACPGVGRMCDIDDLKDRQRQTCPNNACLAFFMSDSKGTDKMTEVSRLETEELGRHEGDHAQILIQVRTPVVIEPQRTLPRLTNFALIDTPCQLRELLLLPQTAAGLAGLVLACTLYLILRSLIAWVYAKCWGSNLSSASRRTGGGWHQAADISIARGPVVSSLSEEQRRTALEVILSARSKKVSLRGLRRAFLGSLVLRSLAN
jgi:hypothetical protein